MAELLPNMRAYLIVQAGITAVFGVSDTRIYVDRIDVTAVYPFAIIRDIDGGPDYAHDGALPDTGSVQVDVYSTAQATADSGRAAIETELSGFTGAMSSITVGSAFVSNKRGQHDPDAQVFMRSFDIEIGQNG
jgi:hypothetical protein